MLKIDDLLKHKIITQPEAEALRNARISTDEQLWALLGNDFKSDAFDANINRVSADKKVGIPTLYKVLSAESVVKSKAEYDPFLRRNWLLLVLGITTVLLLCGLGARALGFLQGVPQPLGLQDYVVLAARDLEVGRTLQPADIYTALLLPQPGFFTTTDIKMEQMHGWILARGVQGQRPLRFQDVLRPQVIAVRDLPVGEIIARDAVSLSWTTYHPKALTLVSAAIGRTTQHGLRSGEVVLNQAVGGNPVVVQSVEIAAGATVTVTSLSPFLPLTLRDLKIVDSTPAPESNPPPEAILKSDITGRQVVMLRAQPANAAGRTAPPPTRISLLFTPRDQGTKTVPTVVKDAILLTSGSDFIVIAARVEDLATIQPLVSNSDLFVLEPLR
jgi:flagella basal body P-ring formation protein FlgA